MVAWNGSREAARATFDALPLLKSAESVEIFCVDPPERPNQVPAMTGIELAAALARHDVNVTLTAQESGGLPDAPAIENRISENSIDPLAMRAYGAPRQWENLLGGVTSSHLERLRAISLW